MGISFRTAIVPAALLALTLPILAAPLEAPAPRLEAGDRWTTEEIRDPAALPSAGLDFERRVLWDLRPRGGAGTILDWTAMQPQTAGLGEQAVRAGADLALCASRPDNDAVVGCSLVSSAAARPGGAPVLWSDLQDAPFGHRTVTGDSPSRLTTGDHFFETTRFRDGATRRIDGKAVAEGIALLPVGAREGLLLREYIRLDDGATRLRYRFVDRTGLTLATLEGATPGAGVAFAADTGRFVISLNTLADDGLEIPYQVFSDALIPGATGFLQYSQVMDRTLAQIHPSWTSVGAMISIDQTSVAYQPDPGDPASQVTLPEVWDFGALAEAEIPFRTFNSTRADQAGQICINGCSTQDLGANPPDGTWQYYLKIDTYNAGNALFTQDWFALNDNDTGANPSIDVSFTIQDSNDTEDTTQVCFAGSAGGADRFLQFFEFQGPSLAAAVMGVGDVWTSGDWSSCSGSNGLALSAASICGAGCYPTCSAPQPFARGRLGGGAGFRSTILEDGYVLMPTGNYIPALLMRQDTDLEAGIDFIVSCALGSTPQRAFDYFWISDRYGLLASVSSPNNDSIPPDDWSAIGNITDGVDFTWGPYPPHQFGATACLNGTRVDWSLPADGSNLGSGPVADYGYVVAWGNNADPEALADFTVNANHSPLPGEAGYLAAPAGGEPTSYTIAGWGGASLNATVVTALRYTDPDVADVTSYQSAAYYKVAADPARLDPVSFVVGEVAPLVDKQGADLELAWPAVADAAGYFIRVFDLDTRLEIPCPAGLDCNPATPLTTFSDGAIDPGNYGFRVLAVDACGDLSLD